MMLLCTFLYKKKMKIYVLTPRYVVSLYIQAYLFFHGEYYNSEQ